MSARHGSASALGVLAAAALTGLAGPATAAETPTGFLVIRAVTTPADAQASFTFDVSCTGAAAPIVRTVVVPTSAGSGSATVEGIPVEAACLIIDRPAAGWRVETSNPQAVVASAEGTTVEFAHSAPVAAAMSIVKTSEPAGANGAGATPPSVRRGATITYVLTYRNEGELPAAATITDEIPAGTTYAGTAVCRPRCARPPTVSAGRIRFAVPVEAKASGTVSYAVHVDDDAADGDVIGALATIEPGRGRSAVVLHRVSVPPGGLRVTTSSDHDSAPVGTVVSYVIDVANAGSGSQDGVTVTDAVPANAEYVDGSATCAAPCSASYAVAGSTVTWHLGSLDADEIATGLSFQARIRPLKVNPDGSLPGTIVLNSAIASSTLTPATPSNEVQTVVVAVLGSKVTRQRPVTIATPANVPTLPATGAPTGALLAAAVGLVVAGVGLIAGERRARPRHLQP